MCSKAGILLLLISISACSQAIDLRTTEEIVECEHATDFLSELILKFLDKLRSHMSTGIPDLNIPPLDPLDVPSESFTVKKQYEYDLKGGISSSQLFNLHEFNVTKISSSLLHMQANVSLYIPYLTLTGMYNLKGKVLQFVPVRGSGPYTIKPSGISTTIHTTMKLQNKHMQVKSMDFTLSLGSFQAKFDGLFGGGTVGNLANSLMNRFGLQIFKIVEPKIHNQIRDDLIKEINQLLKDIPIANLFALLQTRYCK